MAMVPVTSAIAENVQEIEGDVKVIDEPKVFDSSVENSIVGLKEYKDMLLRYKTIIENTDWSVMPPEEALYQLTEMNLDVLRGLQNLLQSNPELLEEIRNVEQTEEFKNTLKEAGLAYTSLEDALTESIQQLESAQGELIPVIQAGMEGPTAMATGIICDTLAIVMIIIPGWPFTILWGLATTLLDVGFFWLGWIVAMMAGIYYNCVLEPLAGLYMYHYVRQEVEDSWRH